MLKVAALVLATFVSVSANADINCMATDVDTSVLEESFTVEEYPEVTASSSEVSIGANSYSEASKDLIILVESQDKSIVKVVSSSGDELEITVDNISKKGEVTYRYDMDQPKNWIADLVCK